MTDTYCNRICGLSYGSGNFSHITFPDLTFFIIENINEQSIKEHWYCSFWINTRYTARTWDMNLDSQFLIQGSHITMWIFNSAYSTLCFSLDWLFLFNTTYVCCYNKSIFLSILLFNSYAADEKSAIIDYMLMSDIRKYIL